ncbi:MAG: ATP-binding SpoIIE family protein phosphatase [Vicinamibacterales bacterium]
MALNVTTAFPMREASQVAEPRRVIERVAANIGFSADTSGRAALIVAELATNLAKHARDGELLLRPLTNHDGVVDGIEILALDKGPGIPDVALSRRDGYSTTGSLGHGLGAIERQADMFELYTQTSGTAILARIWREPPRATVSEPAYELGAVHVSKPGESVCGDSWAWRMREGRLAVFVADGLGHGLPAHEAAESAVKVFTASHESAPSGVVADAHGALKPTRGAAIAALAIDIERSTAAFAGLGNISGVILHAAGGRHNMVSHNGTAGYTAARIQEFAYPVPRGSIVVLFSDGLGSHWNLDAYPGLRQRSSSLIAGVLYRDFSRRRDDVTVVVAKQRPSLATKV